MDYYQTDDQGYLVSGALPADQSPREPGVFLIPRGGVTVQPPVLAANEAAQWVAGQWVIVPDHRGRVYWLADGSRHEILERGIAPPAEALDSAPVLPPSIVTMRQARLALLAQGLLTDVDAAVASMPGVEGDAARIEWEYAATVERDSPLVASLAGALSLTAEQLDALFTQAAAL